MKTDENKNRIIPPVTAEGEFLQEGRALAEKLGASAVELSAAQKNDEEKIYMAPVIMGSLNSYAEEAMICPSMVNNTARELVVP